jgi:hypothetical protein
MKLKLIIAMFVATFISGCAVCGSKKEGLTPKTEVSSPERGTQKKFGMPANARLRKGAAHGRAKMTKEHTSEMLSR